MSWAVTEFETIDLGDPRLNRRVIKITEDFSAKPTVSIPQSGGSRFTMGQIDRDLLMRLASKYVWWKTPEEAVELPNRVMAQVMNIGDYADVQQLVNQMGDDMLREVVTHAQAGQFDQRSWVYWNYRLGLANVDHVPPIPVRRFE